ncbi:MAG: endonuclease Q family protein [Patescibacteria group bacterium]|nr:endonuclease Q family protein [Patescibacteria group bacterium]
MIVDLHLHSHFSRATSSSMDLKHMYQWAKLKGINVLGTGDFTHPEWFEEIQQNLQPAENGLYQLKPKIAQKIDKEMPASYRSNKLRFILTVEISNIYSRGGQVRKLHNVVIAPDLKTVSKINAKLDEIGNLQADGRPILGLDSEELLKIVLNADKRAMLIPAHIWTPWFAMFGSKSGFDSIKEAFGDLASEIKAIETGLSSDPFMNWRLSQLDNVTLVSNSDAHSPYKLGREANIIDVDYDYDQIIEAIRTNDDRFVGTIEFFPQEGKYHYDGHRKCDVCFSPKETHQHKGICPKCGKPLVLGVDYRIDQLADRPADYKPKKHKKVEYIIPLPEIIAEVEGVKGTRTKTVQTKFKKMLESLGDEFSILRQTPVAEIEEAGFPVMAEAIKRMRSRQIHIQPGYDGVYGEIKLFANKDELDKFKGQLGLGF